MLKQKGFTLVELLIVIAILVVLAVGVVLVLNPAELLRQSRDSTRLSDLAAIQSALALWTQDVTTYVPADWVYTTTTCTYGTTFPAGLPASCGTNNTYKVDGTGWISVNFGKISIGSPLSHLPKDPVNGTCGTDTCLYAYKSTAVGTYEINTNLESIKYSPQEGNDGGSTDLWYEIGTNLSL